MAVTNPLATWRTRRGLKQTEAALVLGVSSNALGLAERGDPAEIYPSIIDGMRALGEDEAVIEEVISRYHTWRGELVARLRAQASDS